MSNGIAWPWVGNPPEPDKPGEFYYRIEGQRYAYFDEFGDHQSSLGTYTLSAQKYRVLRTTPKGVWVQYAGYEAWVRNGSGKRLCHETIELALESFIKRKERANSIMAVRMRDNDEGIRQARHRLGTAGQP